MMAPNFIKRYPNLFEQPLWNRGAYCETTHLSGLGLALSLPFCHEALVVTRFPARLDRLYLLIFSFEPMILLFRCHDLLDKIPGSVFLIESGTEPFCRPFDDRAYLRKCRYLAFAVVLLIVPVLVEDRAHFKELQIALELRGYDSLREVKPTRSSR